MAEENSKQDARDILIQAYTDISNSIRHYSNLQFAQLTVFMALAAGIIFQTSPEKLNPWPRIILEIAGAIFGILFLCMSARVSDYWDKLVKQAKEIEEQLGTKQYRLAPIKRYINNRIAVACVYWIFVLAFASTAICECFGIQIFMKTIISK